MKEEANEDLKGEFANQLSDINETLKAGFSSPTMTALQKSELKNLQWYPLWVAIKTRTISFQGYDDFINRVLCTGKDVPKDAGYSENIKKEKKDLFTAFNGVDAYKLLKTATQCYLLMNCGIAIYPQRDPVTGEFKVDKDVENYLDSLLPEDDRRLKEVPYITYGQIVEDLKKILGDENSTYIKTAMRNVFGPNYKEKKAGSPFCSDAIVEKLTKPCLLELIWNYWHEEALLPQTMNNIALRFQNRRGPKQIDPLAEMEIEPLIPLNHILWGYIQDEQNRLRVFRRAYEYDHHYGLRLLGKAVPKMNPADSRSKFIEAFHHLLHRCHVFYQEDADTTVVSDGFPLLNALKEVHIILAEGAHNQYGSLPWQSRAEMLLEQWLLARPEMKEFLRGRKMVPYKEDWMGSVDAMKKLQGWDSTSVSHFSDLGVFGERILLSIRHGNWNAVDDQEHARTWARYWQPEVQGYIHNYRAVTSVDLASSTPVDAKLPGIHLQRRLAEQGKAR